MNFILLHVRERRQREREEATKRLTNDISKKRRQERQKRGMKNYRYSLSHAAMLIQIFYVQSKCVEDCGREQFELKWFPIYPERNFFLNSIEKLKKDFFKDMSSQQQNFLIGNNILKKKKSIIVNKTNKETFHRSLQNIRKKEQKKTFRLCFRSSSLFLSSI